MKLQFTRVVLSALLTVIVSGCASQGARNSEGIDPFCAAVGGVLGGGTAAIISIAAGPIGAGVGVGALLGALACHNPEKVAETHTSSSDTSSHVAPAAPPAVVAIADVDSDGDGVVDRLDRCPGTPAGAKVDVNGCPEMLLSLTGINFKFDSAVIAPGSSEILDRAVASLTAAKDVAVRIEGHCDSTGGETYNQLLSERRARAVQAYLVEHGVAASRLTTLGKGESMPVAPNDSEQGRYQNRRVEFHVAGADAPTAKGEAWRTLDKPGNTE